MAEEVGIAPGLGGDLGFVYGFISSRKNPAAWAPFNYALIFLSLFLGSAFLYSRAAAKVPTIIV